MKKHEELLKHREIKKIGISESGGMIIKFIDGSHTYINPENMKIWMKELFKLVEEGKINDEEE